MATEALVTEGHVGDMKLADAVKDAGKRESFPEPNSIEGKDKEKIQVEDSAAGESFATELVKAYEDELKNQVDATDTAEASADDLEKTLIEESESETAIEPAVPEAASDNAAETVVTEEIPNVHELVDSIAGNPIVEFIEGILKPEDKVEEKIQEKALEGEKTTLAETPRDVDVEDEKNKADIETEGEAAKLEGPAKSSHSKNIFSKVKQSIAKVKKAIIGKAPTSKTITSEVTSEIKVN